MRLLLPLAAAALTTRGGGPLRVLGSTSRQDAGRYQARFDVRAFPSGVYPPPFSPAPAWRRAG